MSIFAWVKRVFAGGSGPVAPATTGRRDLPKRDTEAIGDAAKRLVEIVNESLQLSNQSTNPETKISRLHLAKAKLQELEGMQARSSFLQLTSLEAVHKSIAGLEREYTDAGYYGQVAPEHINSSATYNRTVGELQSRPLADWGNSDIVSGLMFSATLQVRTPLRVLQRHEETFSGPGAPPQIADQDWQGIWLPKVDWGELGDLLAQGRTMSSDVGYIPSDGGDYLPFLLALRRIVERRDPAIQRRAELEQVLQEPKWAHFVERLGGSARVIDQFFPRFVSTLPGLQQATVDELIRAGLTTAASIAGATDHQLLALKGIGQAKLQKIRKACATATDATSEYADLVER